MNKLIKVAVAAALVAASVSANAATTNNDFTVQVNLASQCQAVASGTQTMDFGNYTAFQAGVQNGTGVNLTFNCTRGYNLVSVAFDAVNGTAVGEGVLAGLRYVMAVGAPVVTLGTAATTSSIGTADSRAYAVTGTMQAGQAGACAAATCAGSHTRTLVLTF
jgi:spore coat protein U-like protein